MTHEIDTRLRALERAVVELLTARHIQEARHPNTTTQSPGWWIEARGMIRAAIPAHSDAAPAEPTPAAPATTLRELWGSAPGLRVDDDTPATRWWVVDKLGVWLGPDARRARAGFKSDLTEAQAKKSAAECDHHAPHDAPHLAIQAASADEAVAEYRRRVGVPGGPTVADIVSMQGATTHLYGSKVQVEYTHPTASASPAAVMVVGVTREEPPREAAITARSGDSRIVWAPLTEPPYLTRDDVFAAVRDAGIELPRLYARGYAHNNCGGACVRAGQGAWAHLLKDNPALYAEWEAWEQEMRGMVGPHAILRDRSGGEHAPLPLVELRRRVKGQPDTVDLFDIGGCGCFAPDTAEAAP
ncbi:MAG: hypothetical protein ACK6AH_00180 [Gemmatimonadota bacterium]